MHISTGAITFGISCEQNLEQLDRTQTGEYRHGCKSKTIQRSIQWGGVVPVSTKSHTRSTRSTRASYAADCPAELSPSDQGAGCSQSRAEGPAAALSLLGLGFLMGAVRRRSRSSMRAHPGLFLKGKSCLFFVVVALLLALPGLSSADIRFPDNWSEAEKQFFNKHWPSCRVDADMVIDCCSDVELGNMIEWAKCVIVTCSHQECYLDLQWEAEQAALCMPAPERVSTDGRGPSEQAGPPESLDLPRPSTCPPVNADPFDHADGPPFLAEPDKYEDDSIDEEDETKYEDDPIDEEDALRDETDTSETSEPIEDGETTPDSTSAD